MKKMFVCFLAMAILILSSCGKPKLNMVDIPGLEIKMLSTEVTQGLYESIMGGNPSLNKGKKQPVENVSWLDVVYFCNLLSLRYGLTPAYLVDGKTSPSSWYYIPNTGDDLDEHDVVRNLNANGFRLPTVDEWEYAAKGGENYKYSGSDNLDEVGWYFGNSKGKIQQVAQKKANAYGLYDMSGNVAEWCSDIKSGDDRHYRGGSIENDMKDCQIKLRYTWGNAYRSYSLGFRIVCSVTNDEKNRTVTEYNGGEFGEKMAAVETGFSKMVKLPGKNLMILNTEVTQELYESIMENNPSHYGGDFYPVDSVSWYDAIYFCNKLSEKVGLTPVYSADGITDVSKWKYEQYVIKQRGHNDDGDAYSRVYGEITQNLEANGFRLPTEEEWEYAARGDQDYDYAGSNHYDDVAWYNYSSDERPHSVGQLKPNAYGLYDMSGNLLEWCWDFYERDSSCRRLRGGYYLSPNSQCAIDVRYWNIPERQLQGKGFRIVCAVSE